MKSRFLNVDVELVSPRKLDALVKELGDRVIVLHSGPPPKKHRGYFVSMEICGVRRSRNPNIIIHGLCALIEKLSPAGRRLWDDAEKAFDVGCEILAKDKRVEFALRPDTIQRIGSLGASLAVTCYRGGE